MEDFIASKVLSKVEKCDSLLLLLQEQSNSSIVNALQSYLLEIRCLLSKEGRLK